MNVFLVLLSIILVLLTYILLWYRKQLNYWSDHGIPCDPPHWLYGSFKGINTETSMYDLLCNYYRKYKGTGPFAGFYIASKPTVFILDVKLVQQILIKDFSNFTDHGFYHNEEDDPLSGQLFLLDGIKWKNMRNKLSPTFTSGKMKQMFPIVMDIAKEFVTIIGQEIEQNVSQMEVKEMVARFTVDVIGTCAFGIDCNSLRNPQNEFRRMGIKANIDQRHGLLLTALMNIFPNVARKLHIKQTTDELEQFYMNLVRETVDYREKNNVRRNDLMNTLIDLKNNKLIKSEHGDELTNLTFNEITAQAVVFFNAGFETSSITASFALYELALNTECQEKARQEVLDVLERHQQEFTYECIKEMVYIKQIISETLRLYTVFPMLGRIALNDYPVPGHPKYVIKKGMNVTIPAAAIHRDPDYYPNADVFNPDNFAADMVAQRDPCLWLPFGEGPRNCIGVRFALMQTIVVLAMLLKYFKFSPCADTDIPVKFDKKSFVLNVENGIILKVEKV